MEPKLLIFYDNELNAIELKQLLAEAGVECLVQEEFCQIDIFLFVYSTVVVPRCSSFSAENTAFGHCVSICVIFKQDVHGKKMMTAAPFPAVIVFAVTVVMNQEQDDGKIVFFLPLQKQLVEEIAVVFDAGDAVVLKVNNVVFIIDPHHKSFRIIPIC